MFFHFQNELIGLTILYPVNFRIPSYNPFFDLILHTHFVLPHCALPTPLTFHPVPHLIVTDTAPYHTPTPHPSVVTILWCSPRRHLRIACNPSIQTAYFLPLPLHLSR
ncbi:hypothetical protein M413DRAFT_444450, partial [Hebeloma cylindrosporum]